MPDNYVPRPDLSSANAARQNEKINPNVISDVGTTFGAPIVPIHFYNVSALGWEDIHQICRPPVFPHVFLRACPEGQRYIKACQDMQHPFPQAFEGQNGEKLIRYVDGYIEAAKFLCPENPGTDQDFSVQNGLNIGNNLNEYGIFWSVNEPPLESEIDAAVRRLENTSRIFCCWAVTSSMAPWTRVSSNCASSR